jgi:hypothetical protein
MRYEWLFDIESIDEHLPGGVVETEDSLVLLDTLFSLFRDTARGCWYYVIC